LIDRSSPKRAKGRLSRDIGARCAGCLKSHQQTARRPRSSCPRFATVIGNKSDVFAASGQVIKSIVYNNLQFAAEIQKRAALP
jgi:hypothetical protein